MLRLLGVLLRKDEEEGFRGRSWAALKSPRREEELGCVIPAESGVLVLGKPRN